MRALVTLCCLVALLSPLAAQQPRFRPVPKPDQPEAPAKPAEKPTEASPSQEVTDPVERQFLALAAWPGREARNAALVLSGLGDSVKQRLIGNLSALDWRLQAASAFALSRMGATDALPALKVAVLDDANGAAKPELMRALVALAPVEGTRAIFPILSHKSGRLRVAARRALPERLDASFLADTLKLVGSRKTHLRRAGLELLARIPGTAERDEWFDALADPQSRVASFAMQRLGSAATPAIAERLRELASDGPGRSAAHAFVALAMAEDSSGEALVEEVGPVRERATQLVRSEDLFYRAASAILLSNIAFRAVDPELHLLADESLVPAMLTAVAGGVFFSDYSTVSEACWTKLAMLTGQEFGQNAPAWRSWWLENREDFRARRRLSTITAGELDRAVFVHAMTSVDGALDLTALAGTRFPALPSRPLLRLDDEARARLAKAVIDSGFFSGPDRVGATSALAERHEFRVRLEPEGLEHRRTFSGALPEPFAALRDVALGLRRELAWQVLVPAISDPDFDREATEAFFRGERRPVLRLAREADLALTAWSGLDAAGREIALVVLEATTPAWRGQHVAELAGFLRAEEDLNPVSTRLIALLHGQTAPLAVGAVLAHLDQATGVRREGVLDTWLADMPRSAVEQGLTARRGWIRARAHRALTRFVKDDADPVAPFVAGLQDPDPDVRRACVEALTGFEGSRVLPVLEKLIDEGEIALRLRAIEAIAVVGGEAAVPRLRDLTRSDDRRDRWVAVRALGQAGGEAAMRALSAVVRENGPSEIRREAIESLLTIEDAGIGARLTELLERVKDSDIREDLVQALARREGMAALPTLQGLFEDPSEDLARTAVLAAAALGDIGTRERLLVWTAEIEGDRAAERALEELTFFVATEESPPLRHRAHVSFGERFGTLSRGDWFQRAVREVDLLLDPSVAWLTVTELDAARARSLLEVLKKGTRPLQREADRILRRVSGLPLAELDREPTPTAIERRAAEWATWIASVLAKPGTDG